MAFDPSISVSAEPAEASLRFADQLHALSRVAETLTYRLLDLEEKLAAQEQTLSSLIHSALGNDPGQTEQMDQRLGDTESRLAHIEELLAAADPTPIGRPLHLQALPQSDLLDDPFPEEGEQPFMDERIA
jgi:uncharacterized coiled-coil protein SlyX